MREVAKDFMPQGDIVDPQSRTARECSPKRVVSPTQG